MTKRILTLAMTLLTTLGGALNVVAQTWNFSVGGLTGFQSSYATDYTNITTDISNTTGWELVSNRDGRFKIKAALSEEQQLTANSTVLEITRGLYFATTSADLRVDVAYNYLYLKKATMTLKNLKKGQYVELKTKATSNEEANLGYNFSVPTELEDTEGFGTHTSGTEQTNRGKVKANGDITFSLNNNGAAIQCISITVYASDGTTVLTKEQVINPDNETVGTPSLTFDSGSNQVTITAGTSSYSHLTTTYYTTDNTDPASSETRLSFTEASKSFVISENTTVRVITVSTSGKSSSEASDTYTYTAPVTEINSVSISGLSVPVKGSTLTTIEGLNISTTGVSISSITWDPATTPAAASTVYTATIVMEATSGYQFASTVTANAISGREATITHNSNTQISVAYTFDATEAEATTYTVTIGNHNHGALGLSCVEEGQTSGQAAVGQTITISTEPDVGYTTGTVSAYKTEDDKTKVTVTDKTSFVMPDHNVTVKVTYNKADLTVSSNVSGGHGSLSFTSNNADNTKFQIGNTVTITVTHDNDYKLKNNSLVATYNTDQILVLTSAGDNQYTFTMPGYNVTVAAEFELESPAVTEISSVNISGLSAPVKGTALNTLSDLSTSTTGVSISSISWSPTTTPAAASTAYTATIVMEATFGYQFALTVTANAISGKEASVTRNGNSQITIVYSFDTTAADDPTGTEVSVSTEKTWIFNDYTEETITSNQLNDGLYTRALTDRSWTISAVESQNLTIGGKEISVSKIATASGGMNTPNTLSLKTANESTNSMKPAFAFNTSVAGTCYVLLQEDAESHSTGYRQRIYFGDGTNAITCPVSSNGAGNLGIEEISYTSTSAGTFVVGATGSACKIYAIRFVPVPQHKLTATSEAQGSITVMKGSENVTTAVASGADFDEGSSFTLTATPNSSYAFDKWTDGNEQLVSTENPYTISSLSNDVTLKAKYREKVTYTFSVTNPSSDEGTITVYKNDEENPWTIVSPVDEGTKIKLVATPKNGYTFVNWKNGEEIVSTNATYTIESLSQNMTLTATFISSSSVVPVILTAGQSNTDGRISDAIPSDFKGLQHCYWSYCNAKSVPSGTFEEAYRKYTPGFSQYSPASDCGANWAYDAVVYDLVGKALNSDFYVIKQAKGNTSISPDGGGCGVFWGADRIYRNVNSTWGYDETWFDENTSVNSGGLSLMKGFIENIDASMSALEDQGKLGEIKFMLWHQGECDSKNGNTAFAYYENLKAVVNYIRNYLATKYGEEYLTLPFICGTVAKNSGEYHAYVENALYRLQKDLTNFYVINMSLGTFISDGIHFNQETATRLGKKMYNKIVENGYISGITVEVEDIDAQIYNDNVYDFQNWANVNTEAVTTVGADANTYKAISLANEEISTGSGLYLLNNPTKDNGMQADMPLNGRFALSSVTSTADANGAVNFRISQRSNANTGLRTKANTTVTLAILNLNPGDAVTIACSSNAIAFKSTNAYLATDETKANVSEGDSWATGTKYIVKSGNRLDLTFGGNSQMFLYSVKINPGEGSETLAAPTITSEMEDGKAVVTITATTSWGNAADIYYTTNGVAPTSLSTKYTAPFTLTEAATVKAIAVYESLTSDVAEELVSLVEPSAAVTYDFMGAYAADNNVSLAIGTEETSINYIRNNEPSNKSVNVKAIGLDPVNGRIAWQGGDVSITDKGLKTSARAFVIKYLKVGDKIRIEYDGEIYYARSGNYGHSLKNLTTGDAIENMTAYTVNSVDETNNYLAFWVPTSTTISQISINQELTQKVMPTPKIKVKDESTFTYTISYMNGAKLYYKKPGDSEYQTKTSGTSIDVQATKLGKIEAYATMNGLTSGTASVTANVPTKAIEDEDGTYDFAKVKEMMSSDYVLGFGDAVTVGGFTLYKPDAVVATTLDQFAFAPKLKADGNKQVSANEWRLMAAGRLRATKSAIADTLAVLSLTKGQYVTFTYSGASLKYMSQSTAKLAEGTDVLTSKQAYEVLSDGVLLLTVPADEANYCDITAITITGNEKVTPPTFTARDNANEVTLRLGTSSFGKTVTAYYTTDGTTPTTSSTAVTKTTTIKVDESCTIKAYCVSETGKASTVAEYEISLEASSKSPSVVYDWTNIVAHSDTIKFSGDEVRVVYQAYNSSESTWKSTASSHFQPASSFDNKVSVLNGYKSLQYNNDNQTIRLTQPLAIHNLGVGDEIVIFYSGGDLYSAYDEAHDSYTVDGSAAKAGMSIISGALIKVTKTMYSNNYIVVTPRGTTNSVTYIQAIYINHATPSYASTPKVALYDVVDTTAIYRFTFSEGTMLHYILEKEGVELQGNNKGTYDLTIGTSDRIKAWATSGTAVSDTLQTVLFAPTPAPSEEGGVDFTEASTDLPADLEVTLDPNKPVTVGGITLYKPTALTAATFDNRFAFTETNKSGKIRIRTNRTLMFAKGDNVNMGLLNLKQGDIVAFEFTGTIRIADGSSLSLESARAGTRESGTRADGDNLMESGSAYVVQKDGSLLLTIELTEASASINKMYVAAVPSKSKAAAIDFATASEEYETLAPGNATGVFYNGKTTAQTFYRLTNETRELPIDGKISTEGGAGEIINSGIKAGNRRIAIHALGKGDEIRIRFYGGNVTYEGHETKGDIVRVNGKRLAPGDTLRSGDVLKVEYVDYLNNYVVLKLDSKVSISGIFINRDEVEKIWMPTIVDQGSNTVLITAGRSSMDNPVSTSYTIDGSEPTERNGTSGPYEEFDVQLLGGNIVTIKAVSYNNRGMYSKVASLVIYASEMTDIPGITVDGNGQRQDVYDLYGRKVESLRRGQIYIVNGKKIFFK